MLCLVLIVVQVVVSLLGGFAKVPQVFEWFGLRREGLMEGRIWQLGTHALLHGNWIHFVMNFLVIALIGGRVYHIMGGRGFGVIFGGGVLVGSVFHLAFHPAQPMGFAGEIVNAPLVGASGGAMALLIALTALSPESRMWPVPVSGKNLGRGILLAAILLFTIMSVILEKEYTQEIILEKLQTGVIFGIFYGVFIWARQRFKNKKE